MRNHPSAIFIFVLCGLLGLWPGLSRAETSSTKSSTEEAARPQITKISQGLQSLKFRQNSSRGLTLLLFDPQYYRLRLLMASEIKLQKTLSAKQWVEKYKLVGAGNAGMYQEDHLTSVGFMVSGDHINNPRIGRDNAVLAFDPSLPDLPRIQIIDRKCQSFDNLKKNYRSFVQSIRMISCQQNNTWKADGQASPILAIGTNKEGKVFFAFSEKSLTPREFTETLMSLPLNVYNLMYLEGGPPAQFYLKSGSFELNFSGSHGFPAGAEGDSSIYLPIPNVLGIAAVK